MSKDRKTRHGKKTRAAGARRATRPQFEVSDEAEFLGIDLDVRSRYSLFPLVAAWPGSHQPLRMDGKPNPRWLIFSPYSKANTAEAKARLLIELVADLSPVARRCWNRASTRTFDIGVQASASGRAFEEVQLSTDTLSRIASIGGRLIVTVYPSDRAPR